MKQDAKHESQAAALYVLPFDHRFPYANEVFGFQEKMTADEERQATALKQVIYDSLAEVVAGGLPAESVAVLVDDRFGADILRAAKKRGLTTILPIEQSGAAEFTFEHGSGWREQVERFDPAMVKVLVQSNPQGDRQRNLRQLEKLKPVSDYCRQTGRRFMYELIVPPEPQQLAAVVGERARFDAELRPALMLEAIEYVYNAGIEPDVWKIEGLETAEDCRRIGAAVRSGGRDHVGCVVLGRGENEARVRQWLETAAATPGFVGFAVGRSIFAAPLVALREGRFTAEQARHEIARQFGHLAEIFEKARHAAAGSGTR